MIEIRPAAAADSRALWSWRNDPQTRAASLTTREVVWADHERWFAAVLADPSRLLYMGETQDALDAATARSVGTVRFDVADDVAEISITIAPSARGEGLSRPLLLAAIQRFRSDAPRVRRIVARVREANGASVRSFVGAGFSDSGQVGGVRSFEFALSPSEPN